MADITARSKWLFWGLALTVFLLAAVPSAVLIEKAEDYHRFLSGWSPTPLKRSRTDRLPPIRNAEDGDLPEIHFVEFRHRAPGAEAVGLGGSFNRWQADALPMERDAEGAWSTIVPLPPGTYYYAFMVDGSWKPDAKASKTAKRAGRDVSVREVPGHE